MTLYDLQKNKNYYCNLKDSLISIIKNIDNAIDSINNAIKNSSTLYSVDDDSKCVNELKKQKEKLLYDRNFLSNKVIASVNTQIVKIKKQIEQMKLT